MRDLIGGSSPTGSAVTLREVRKSNAVRDGLQRTGLYHSFELSDGRVLRGAMDIEFQRSRWQSFGLPEDLSGLRVLDIGPWDGFFSFEAERRGAAVTAVDYVDLDTFRALHRMIGSRVEYRTLDIYELSPAVLGTFDIVLCLGVLYHLKHPLLGLERVCSVTTDTCIVDTFVSNGDEHLAGRAQLVPTLEFYERDELGGQLDNWCGPSVEAVAALARAAGFARVSLLDVAGSTARYACRRKWLTDGGADAFPPLGLNGLHHHLNKGRSFRTCKEEYVEVWCAWPAGAPAPGVDQVYPEIDGFGGPPLAASVHEGQLHVSFRVPPGLRPGRHDCRIRTQFTNWSEHAALYVDLPPIATAIAIIAVQDGCSWTPGKVSWSSGGWATVWVSGLSAEADPGNTTVEISGVPHFPDTVDPVTGQVNVRLRPVIDAGEHTVVAVHRGSRSEPLTIAVTGDPPPVAAAFEQLRT
jgi:tRNA (mo5U34)-methyltransferase